MAKNGTSPEVAVLKARVAMARGVAVAVLVAAFIVSFAVAWTTAVGAAGMGPHPFTASDIADMLLFRLASDAPVLSFIWPGTLYVVGAAVVGAATGVIARKLKGTARRRSLVLIGISPLGPWLLAAAMVAIPPLSNIGLIQRKALGFAAFMTFLSLPLALPYVVYVAPLVAPTVVVGHLLLEGWTRPPRLPAVGFARPGVRRAVLLLLLCATTAFTTFSLFRARL